MGYTIGLLEIENSLMKHPAVHEAVVVGSPDKERGQIVNGFIVTVREPSEESKREVQESAKTLLSKHEYPREIKFINELPKTQDSKIKRKELREYETAKKLARWLPTPKGFE